MQRSFCLCTQIYMMKMQHQAHTAVQENNCLQLMCFSNFYHYILISICTAMHACAHYAEVLSQIETLHPDLKDTKLKRFIYTSPRPLPSLNSS